jgi:predicted Zn finger-like uncharacterized protein
MYTQCPKCLTYFQVSAEHLKVAQGNVRCGQCSNVFSALGNLSEVPPQGPGGGNNGGATRKNTPQRGPAPAPAANANSQSKLTNAIAAIQALNQSSQQFLTQSRKHYVTQLQRQAQAKRKYPNVDGRSATARDLNNDPASDKLTEIANEALQEASPEFNFDEALAAVDQIDIEINDEQSGDDEAPIQYGNDDDDDITPAFDGSHLVEDYSTQVNEARKSNTADAKTAKKTVKPTGAAAATNTAKAKPARNESIAGDDFDFSQLEMPDTDDGAKPGKTGASKSKTVTAKSTPSKARKEKAKPQQPTRKKVVKQKLPTRRTPGKKTVQSRQQSARPQPEPEQPMVIENNIPTLAIPKQLLEDFQQEPAIPASHYRSMVSWGIGSLLLMFLFLGQTVYFKHNELGQISQLRPWVAFFCKTVSCELDMQADIGQIELLGQDIRSHPKTKKALMVSATIINNAPFTQPYPGLRLSFSDMNGEKVAMRNFLPKDYLPSGYDVDEGMESNVPIQLELEIVDPGKNAVNFEFDFFSI